MSKQYLTFNDDWTESEEMSCLVHRHLDAMTKEGLSNKTAIAVELARRDLEIEKLQTQLDEAKGLLSKCSLVFSDLTESDLEMNGWDNLDGEIYVLLNPQAQEEE